MDKKTNRLRRARRARAKIRELGAYRLAVHRTPKHIYAQVISPSGDVILASASTLDADVKKEVSNGGNSDAAKVVGRIVSDRAKIAGITKVAFDRSGFRYHGRIKVLADAARENGLEF